MTKEIWNKVKPAEGQQVKVVWEWDGRREEHLLFKRITNENKLILETGNWAGEFYMIPLEKILYIKPITA